MRLSIAYYSYNKKNAILKFFDALVYVKTVFIFFYEGWVVGGGYNTCM